MPVDRKLIEELCGEMGVSERRVYQKIKEITDAQLVSRENAAYMLAYEVGIKLPKYKKGKELEEIRDLVKSSKLKSVRILKKVPGIKKVNFNIRLDNSFRRIREPLLPKQIFEDAKKMAKIYPVVYIYENSIRYLIIVVMSYSYGKNWWEVKIKKNPRFKNICKEVERRKKAEKEFRWHGKRASHDIFYTDIDDLRKIVNEYWKDFKGVLRDQSWFDYMLKTINMSRRIIAHNNPLADRDFKRVEMNFQDWCDQIKLAEEKLGVHGG